MRIIKVKRNNVRCVFFQVSVLFVLPSIGMCWHLMTLTKNGRNANTLLSMYWYCLVITGKTILMVYSMLCVVAIGVREKMVFFFIRIDSNG